MGSNGVISFGLFSGVIRKYKELPNHVVATLWFTLCNVLQKCIVFMTTPILTRMLSTKEYGQYSYWYAWISILAIFMTLSLPYGVINKGMVKYGDERNEFVFALQVLSSTITSLFVIVYIFFRESINIMLGLDTYMVMAIFLYMYVFPLFVFWSTQKRFELEYKRLVLLTLVFSVLSPLSSILFILFVPINKEYAVISGFVFSNVVVFLILLPYVAKGRKCKKMMKYIDYSIKYSLPLIPHFLSQIILGQSDRLMIGRMLGAPEAAMYSIAYQISIALNFFTNAVNSAFIPWLFEKLKKNDLQQVRQYTKILIIMMAMLSFVIMLIAPEFILLMGGKAYVDAIPVVPIVSASLYFTYVYSLYSNVEMYFEANGGVSVASIGGALLNVVLNAFLIPKFGYIAAAYTTLFSYISIAIFHYILYMRVAKKNKIELFDSFWIFGVGFIVIISSILISQLYSNLILRLALLILLILVSVKYGIKELKNFALEIRLSRKT